ncbi:MSMEG_0568 family radical SAM protein [Oculatella sp. LEGE 06141]|uniref:MSMEG_0568 family radical SAM protein n=1 Tax=Oculatella sp. LEGE 06141 TaxID=1828648 RepID=UPI001881FA7C|nr:MSMEG_0568 family radical SAM protein [Oculatella sp. LEGE 06141]MBE9181271.1 MSMEG_0568 family radical SAM protein [Oculatella sp. LEGE 06141]
MNKQQLITELQSNGLKVGATHLENEAGQLPVSSTLDAVLLNPQDLSAAARKGGAGPSDHKAVTVDGTTVMVPIFTSTATQSPYQTEFDPVTKQTVLKRDGVNPIPISFPTQPQFYRLTTADGTPYWKIALLHSHDVLATTVLQTCMRYSDAATSCQFCAIGQSLEAGRTIARKTPAQLAEVAEAAVRLDGVKHLVMTTGTPNTSDRGAAYLTECARAVKAVVDLPIQAQCEPPDDFAWFQRMKAAGVDSLGMHLEAVDPQVRARVMPGKASVPLDYYFEAFAAAVDVFGWGQVSTYLLAGLGDDLPTLLEACDRLTQLGVYPFVVPFVPITGTPLAHQPAPSSELMMALYQQVSAMLQRAGLSSQEMKAGCAKCGACSALSTFETQD